MDEDSDNVDPAYAPVGQAETVKTADTIGDTTGRVYDAVLEGGGIWGIGHIGAYASLYERGYRPKNLAGTSAGAIVACLIAAGYDQPADLMRLFESAFTPDSSKQNWWSAPKYRTKFCMLSVSLPG